MALRLAVSFDENSGTTFSPVVGPGSGAITDPTKVRWVPGVNGSALGQYNGLPGFDSGFRAGLSGLDSLAMSSWSAMTVMAWVLIDEESVQADRWPVVLMSSASTDDGWMGWRVPTNSSLVHSHLNGVAAYENYLASPSIWQHLCTTWDGTTQRLYIDGVLSGESIVAGPLANTTHISIGATYSQYGGAGIDDLRLYDEALTDVQITALMGQPTGNETGGGGTQVNKLRIGTITPNKLYVGTTEINKAYRGTTLVYGTAGPGDPEETVPRLYMTPDTAAFTTGATVQVTIRADSQAIATNVVQANFTYPTSRLSFQSIDTSMSPYTTSIQSTGGSGEVKIGVGILAGETSGDQIVGVVTFTATAAGSATLSFTGESGIVERETSSNICELMSGSVYTIT